jgi:AraC-like DNA-binding protein
VTLDLPADGAARSIMLWALTNLSLLPRRLVGMDAPRPIAVECSFASPSTGAARELRAQLPFKFDAPANRVVFPVRAGEARIGSADEDMQELLSQVIEQRLNRLGPPGNFERGLATILRGMVNGTKPTLASLSAHMGMSQRTLQRRLTESRTSFQRLLRQVLREISDELLARGTVTQGEIAFLLGYSEVSAFSHAYRSWTGRAPGAVRIRRTIPR